MPLNLDFNIFLWWCACCWTACGELMSFNYRSLREVILSVLEGRESTIYFRNKKTWPWLGLASTMLQAWKRSSIWILGYAVVCINRDFGKRVFLDQALPMPQCISLTFTRFSVVNWRFTFLFIKLTLKHQRYGKILPFVTRIFLVPFWFGIRALKR